MPLFRNKLLEWFYIIKQSSVSEVTLNEIYMSKRHNYKTTTKHLKSQIA